MKTHGTRTVLKSALFSSFPRLPSYLKIKISIFISRHCFSLSRSITNQKNQKKTIEHSHTNQHQSHHHSKQRTLVPQARALENRKTAEVYVNLLHFSRMTEESTCLMMERSDRVSKSAITIGCSCPTYTRNRHILNATRSQREQSQSIPDIVTQRMSHSNSRTQSSPVFIAPVSAATTSNCGLFQDFMESRIGA